MCSTECPLEVLAALRLSVLPRHIPCRAEQEKEIRSRVLNKIRSDTSEVIYIAGQPGTGKTLTVHRVIEKLIAMRTEGQLSPFELVSINALNDLTSPDELYTRLYGSLLQVALPPAKVSVPEPFPRTSSQPTLQAAKVCHAVGVQFQRVCMPIPTCFTRAGVGPPVL
jgi:Cdc6-like AAA superfamily ATPase